MRYLVFAFYPNLGIKVRTTEYSNKNEMFEYIGQGLRMCDTPYVAVDTKSGDVIDKDVSWLGGLKMAEMLEEHWNLVKE